MAESYSHRNKSDLLPVVTSPPHHHGGGNTRQPKLMNERDNSEVNSQTGFIHHLPCLDNKKLDKRKNAGEEDQAVEPNQRNSQNENRPTLSLKSK